MQRIQDISSRFTAAVIAGGTALVGSGIMQVTYPHEGAQDELTAATEYVTLALLTVSLLLITPGFIALSRYARSHKGAVAAATGTVVLAVVCTTSLVNGKDLSIFAVFAPLTNALWLFGSVALAVSMKRAGQVPKAVYIGLPLAWVATIPLSPIGGPALAGAYWLAVGYLLRHGGVVRRSVTPATA